MDVLLHTEILSAELLSDVFYTSLQQRSLQIGQGLDASVIFIEEKVTPKKYLQQFGLFWLMPSSVFCNKLILTNPSSDLWKSSYYSLGQ